MFTRILLAAVSAILAGTLGLPLAYADIYTWTDASGAINVSNMAPPDGVRVTHILRAPPPEIVARQDAARETALKVEAQALAERVRQLEDAAARQAMPPPDYRPLPAPPVIQYIVQAPAPPMQQIVEMTQPVYSGCDPAWAGCGGWWGSGFFPASVIVLRAPNFRSVRSIHGNSSPHPPGHFFGPRPQPNFAVQQPMHSFGAPQSLKRG
ncbi:MAG TPA: DUF4124 domain-containing protein [Casimicrobiaceae bacterium]|jgi:hypothetical protein